MPLWNPVPRVTLNFVGFPAHVKSGAEAPSRRVIAELPEPTSKSSRVLTVADLIVMAKKEHLPDDQGVDPYRCALYTSDYAAIPNNSSVGVLRDGESLIVSFYGGALDKKRDDRDRDRDREGRHSVSHRDRDAERDDDRRGDKHGRDRDDKHGGRDRDDKYRDRDDDRKGDKHGGRDDDRRRDDHHRDDRKSDKHGRDDDRKRDDRDDRGGHDRKSTKDGDRDRDHKERRQSISHRDRDDDRRRDRDDDRKGDKYGRDDERKGDKYGRDDERKADKYGRDDDRKGDKYGREDDRKSGDKYRDRDDDRKSEKRDKDRDGKDGGSHSRSHSKSKPAEWSSVEDIRGGSSLKDSKKHDYSMHSSDEISDKRDREKSADRMRRPSSAAATGDRYGREKERERSRSRERERSRHDDDDRATSPRKSISKYSFEDDLRGKSTDKLKGDTSYPDYLKSKSSGSGDRDRPKTSHSRETSVNRYESGSRYDEYTLKSEKPELRRSSSAQGSSLSPRRTSTSGDRDKSSLSLKIPDSSRPKSPSISGRIFSDF